jgi:hypothetical protein
MKPVEKVLSGLEGVVESEGISSLQERAGEVGGERDQCPHKKIYALAMQKYQGNEKAAEPAPEPDSSNDAAMVRNTEEVSHVEQRHDRSSQIT